MKKQFLILPVLLAALIAADEPTTAPAKESVWDAVVKSLPTEHRQDGKSFDRVRASNAATWIETNYSTSSIKMRIKAKNVVVSLQPDGGGRVSFLGSSDKAAIIWGQKWFGTASGYMSIAEADIAAYQKIKGGDTIEVVFTMRQAPEIYTKSGASDNAKSGYTFEVKRAIASSLKKMG